MKWFVAVMFVTSLGLVVSLAGSETGQKGPDQAEKEKMLKKEWEKFRGNYELVKGTIGGQEIKGAHRLPRKPALYLFGVDGWGFQFVENDKVKNAGVFTLDPLAKPKRFTLRFTDKDLKKSATRVGIYSLAGDDLVLAFNVLNPNHPPSDFSGSGQFEAVLHLRRTKTEP